MPDDRLTVSESAAVILAAAGEMAERVGPSNKVDGLARARQLVRAMERLLTEISSLSAELEQRTAPPAPDPKPQPRRPVPARTGGTEPPAEGCAP